MVYCDIGNFRQSIVLIRWYWVHRNITMLSSCIGAMANSSGRITMLSSCIGAMASSSGRIMIRDNPMELHREGAIECIRSFGTGA